MQMLEKLNEEKLIQKQDYLKRKNLKAKNKILPWAKKSLVEITDIRHKKSVRIQKIDY